MKPSLLSGEAGARAEPSLDIREAIARHRSIETWHIGLAQPFGMGPCWEGREPGGV